MSKKYTELGQIVRGMAPQHGYPMAILSSSTRVDSKTVCICLRINDPILDDALLSLTLLRNIGRK